MTVLHLLYLRGDFHVDGEINLATVRAISRFIVSFSEKTFPRLSTLLYTELYLKPVLSLELE